MAERSRINKRKGIAALLKKSRSAKRLRIAKSHRESGLSSVYSWTCNNEQMDRGSGLHYTIP